MQPLDAAFLVLEDADPHAGLHIGSIGVFEGPPPSHEQFTHGVERKLAGIPRYRQRIRRVPFSLAPPAWVDDDEFDIGYHVRRTALPAPGNDAMLWRLVGRLMSQRLDRDKPLWESWVIEGLAGGRWALVSKVHHCLVDGIAGTDVLAATLDLSPEAELPPPQPWQPRPAPSSVRLLTEALMRQASEPAKVGWSALRALMAPRSTVIAARTYARGAVHWLTALMPTGESSLSGWAGQHRRYRCTTLTFADIKVVRQAFGGTVNDVALAVATAGLRDLLLSRGENPGRHTVRSLVPVSTRAPGEESIRDNRVSAMLLDLPVHLSDPVEQLRAVQAAIGRLKTSGEAVTGTAVTRATVHMPFELVEPLLRTAFRLPQRYLTTVTTNVPGPPFPLYAFGRRMLHAYPYVPIGDRMRIGIAMFSYDGELTYGVTSDAATTPDADVLVAGFERGIAALTDAARRKKAPKQRPTARARRVAPG